MQGKRACTVRLASVVSAQTASFPIWLGTLFASVVLPRHAAGAQAGWQEMMLGSRAAGAELEARVEKAFPVQWDWLLQDQGTELYRQRDPCGRADIERKIIERVLKELGPDGRAFQAERRRLCEIDAPLGDRCWLDLYARACERRREIRLRSLLAKWPKIVFTKHFNLGGSHYAYTEGQSDAQRERHFVPASALCLLEFDGVWGRIRTLIDDPNGVIRDPDVSYDGKRILLAWKKSDRQDDYHLYELDVATCKLRQLTFGLGFADYEGAYLPSGDLIFNSTRCVQTVDCWWTEVSNLYTCDRNGKHLRRLSVDQVHTNFPTVLDNGRVVYTRWEYSDRGQIFPQPLFQMNPDGTGQTEFYGNNAWFPTTLLHARGIPGTRKVVAVVSGHHTRQTGKLTVIDPGKGRQENAGLQLVAPVRETKAVRVDRYGQKGDLFQYPYPLSETEFLVTYAPFGWQRRPVRFKVYFMTADDRRELLAADPRISCNQPVPLAPRPRPHVRPDLVDHGEKTGTYFLQDVYAGPGLAGVARGTIKRLRVVALEYRAAGIRSNRNRGPGGAALISTPIAIDNGSWDVKVVLGDAKVWADGSACFVVPARTPVYFQALDANGHAVQTMRSWSTLQPGECFSCVGCHETKSDVPRGGRPAAMAVKAGPQRLAPFYGPPRGFSFVREIQPILDRHCVCCHKDRSRPAPGGLPPSQPASRPTVAFSLLGTQIPDQQSGRKWSDAYLALTQRGRPNRLVHWISAQSAPPMLPPYHAGAAASKLVAMLEKGHNGVALSREEMDKIACWVDLLVPYCGDYTEANAWSEAEANTYDYFLQKRRRMAHIERRNIEALIAARNSP